MSNATKEFFSNICLAQRLTPQSKLDSTSNALGVTLVNILLRFMFRDEDNSSPLNQSSDLIFSDMFLRLQWLSGRLSLFNMEACR